MSARARNLRDFLLARPCSYCGERRRRGEPVIVHVPGCAFATPTQDVPTPERTP